MAQLLLGKKDSLFEEDTLTPDEEIKLRNDLGKLSTNLIKSILQTSFYKTEHKLTQAAVHELFESLEPLTEYYLELTFVSSPDETKPDFSVEGILVEPIPLTSCIKSVLRDEFLGKLRDFFVWNKLVSFSVKKEMTREHYLEFLRLTRRKLPSRPDTARPDAARPEGEEPPPWEEADRTPPDLSTSSLSDALIEHELFTISAICRDELMFVNRTLPWRVKLALGRLMKNLKDIPLYSKATKRELQEAKTLLIQEIIRPLRGRDLLMEFLLNCDLVRESGSEELREMDIEREILSVLNRFQLLSVSACFVAELERLSVDPTREVDRRQKSIVLMKKCLLPLSDILDEESMGIFRRAEKGGFITMEELPENVQAHIQVEKQVDRFLEDPQPTLDRIQAITDLEGFRKDASNVSLMVSDLLRRKEFVWARQIVDLMTYLGEAPLGVQEKVRQLAKDSLESIATKDNFERLIKPLASLRPKDQAHVYHLCKTFRARSVPALVAELRNDIDTSLRAGIRSVLEQMNEEQVLEFLRHALERPKQRWEFYRDLLLVMATVRDTQSYQVANTFLGAEEPEVRQAAFSAITRIGQLRAEKDLVRGLMDPDLAVRRAVVLHLGEVGSKAPEFTEYLQHLFVGAMRPSLMKVVEALWTRRYKQVQMINMQLMNSGVAAISHLLESGALAIAEVEPRLSSALSKLMRFRFIPDSEDVALERKRLINNLITVLRARGTAASLNALRNVRDRAGPDVRHLATNALREIKTRESISLQETWQGRLLRTLRAIIHGD